MIGCRYCLLPGAKGIGPRIGGIFEIDEEFFNHMEDEHDLVIRRHGETEEEAKVRVKAKNPRMGTENCRCPACLAQRRSGVAGALQLMNKLRNKLRNEMGVS